MKAAVFVLLASVALAPGIAGAQALPPTITVAGSGAVTRAPDQAIVGLSIVTSDDAATRATTQNEAVYRRLVAAMARLGLGAAALRTAGYNVRYNPRPPRPNPDFAQRYGYVVEREVDVTTPRTDQAGAIVDAAVGAGVSGVRTVSFGIKEEREAYRAALAAAVADAQAQAQALAAVAHVRLGEILAIAPPGGSPIRPLARVSAEALAPPVPTELPPSELTVRASVTIIYRIAP